MTRRILAPFVYLACLIGCAIAAAIVKDAAKGVLWLDDCQVCAATVEKFIAAQGEAPRILIEVEAIGEMGDETLRLAGAA